MKRLILALLTSAAFAASSPAHAAVKTIVLVHGAFADGSGWKPVADIIVSHGYSVRVVQEPETSFDADVAAHHLIRCTTFASSHPGVCPPRRQYLVRLD